MSTGFEFECYTRDKIIKEELQNIKRYQEGQKDLEQWKRHTEKQERRKTVPKVAASEEVLQRAQELRRVHADARSGYNKELAQQ